MDFSAGLGMIRGSQRQVLPTPSRVEMTSRDRSSAAPLLKKMDGVELLERVYAPEPDWERWALALIDVVRPALARPRRLMFSAVTHRDELTDLHPVHVIGDLPTAGIPTADEFFARLEPETVATVWYPGKPVATHSELLPNLSTHRATQLAQSRMGYADCVGAFAYPQPGVVVVLCVLLEEVGALTPVERRFLSRVAAHLEGGTRLRLRPDLSIAAVLRPDGRLVDASHDDVAQRRDHLAREVQAIEHARRRSERGDPETLRHWRALVDGAYTIVPRQVGASSRREYLFVNNTPLARRDARLGTREAEVVRRVARGSSQKEVAYTLGISEGSVSAALERARMRLGLPSRLELVRVARGAIGLVGQSTPSAALTQAEAAVLSLLREGLTNAEIARLRDASQHTVANQVAAILRKTSAASRRELAARPDEH